MDSHAPRAEPVTWEVPEGGRTEAGIHVQELGKQANQQHQQQQEATSSEQLAAWPLRALGAATTAECFAVVLPAVQR